MSQVPTTVALDLGGPYTLAIDIGGTRLKMGVLDAAGTMIDGPATMNTPHPSPPGLVVDGLLELATDRHPFERVSVGFPGVVRGGVVLTAPNLGTDVWAGFPLGEVLGRRLGKPVRILNDATVQGLGVISGRGLECVITLGTGFGFALFQDGRLTPHLEVGQHNAWRKMTYDQYLGNAALKDLGRRRWNKRLRRAIAQIDTLVMFDQLLIGGGNARYLTGDLPPRVRLVPNEAGITGGVRLWGAAMESAFPTAPSLATSVRPVGPVRTA